MTRRFSGEVRVYVTYLPPCHDHRHGYYACSVVLHGQARPVWITMPDGLTVDSSETFDDVARVAAEFSFPDIGFLDATDGHDEPAIRRQPRA